MEPTRPLNLALYGTNGHQLSSLLSGEPHPLLRVVAVCGKRFAPEIPGVTHHPSLEAILEDPAVELVSLCSPRRADQAADAIRALEAGRHVLAEKPAALCESDLDAILSAARANGRRFREMGGTIYNHPYRAMREKVTAGELGQVVQVFAQKSYPFYPGRAQDEALDGGLLLQSGIHAVRMIEHTTRLRFTSLSALETKLGNPETGELRMAASFQGRLENGALASAILNYLNPEGFGHWGNETLRIFGTNGMAETTDGGTRSRWIVGETDHGPLPPEPDAAAGYAEAFAREILLGEPMPLSLEEELHPLRALLRCRRTLPGPVEESGCDGETN